MSYNVALVGAGNIGLLYDLSRSKKSARSHAKAVYLHKSFTLKYVVDKKRQLFSKVRELFPSVRCLTEWPRLVNNRDIDVLVIALPTELHFKCLKDFENNNYIKLFFIEKPLFSRGKDYSAVSQNVRGRIVVNYVRRFTPAIISLRQEIEKGIYQRPLKIICKYTKGLRHNGAHLVNLLHYLFNGLSIETVKVLDKRIDWRQDDPTLDFFVKVKYKNLTFPAYFIGANEHSYSVFELDILFENKRIELIDFGRVIRRCSIESDPEYKGYKTLAIDSKPANTNMQFAMLEAYNILEQIINNRIKNISSFQDEIDNFNFIKLVQSKAAHV